MQVYDYHLGDAADEKIDNGAHNGTFDAKDIEMQREIVPR